MPPRFERKTPAELEYYLICADAIKIFWEWYLLVWPPKLKDSEIQYFPFDPESAYQEHQLKSPTVPFDLVFAYRESITTWMQQMWTDFALELPKPEDSPHLALIQDPFVQQLLNSADQRAEDFGRAVPSFRAAVLPALRTGVAVPSQLTAILGDHFTPEAAHLLSKVELEHNRTAQARIGIPNSKMADSATDFSLIDLTAKSKLAKSILLELGYVYLGCPAGMQASKECKAFLRRYLEENGQQRISSLTVIEDFALVIYQDFQRVLKWYESLLPDVRQRTISENTQALLDGRVLKECAVSNVAKQSCPYHR